MEQKRRHVIEIRNCIPKVIYLEKCVINKCALGRLIWHKAQRFIVWLQIYITFIYTNRSIYPFTKVSPHDRFINKPYHKLKKSKVQQYA